jgi:hypothetical protein
VVTWGAHGRGADRHATAQFPKRHDEFQIGLQFWCGSKRWRCTDVGTRVITATSSMNMI